jgi:hypothetical protein
MGGVKVYETGMDGLLKYVRKVAAPPTFHVTSGLEAALDACFAHTQAQVHIISGRLKASGFPESDLDGHIWEGSVNYGGVSGTPAYYGIYECYRGGTRPDGTPHDFFSGLEQFDSAFEAAIDAHFEPL